MRKATGKAKTRSTSKSKSAKPASKPTAKAAAAKAGRSTSPKTRKSQLKSTTIATRPKAKPGRSRSITEATIAAAPLAAASGGPIDQITRIAAQSAIAGFNWPGRGVAPAGYIKGMAVVFARVLCKLLAGDAAATDMAKANTGDTGRDALAWYDANFAAAGMNNNTAGADTLRHLFVLLIGLGMRESSGKHCEGRDRSASNTTADTAEAGLFQASFNARTASPLLPQLFAQYSANPLGFVDIFQEGVRCSAASLANFGSGNGKDFQRLSKECPAFAAEFAAVGLRHFRRHWGPINRREAQVRAECDAMLSRVQALVTASPNICSALQ